MTNTPHQIYQQNQAQTATPEKLLIMLYDGAIRFVKLGIEGIDHKNIQQANNYLCRAQSIVHEWIASLDFNYPISKQLLSVYEYLLHLLIQANVKKDRKPAEEALNIIIEMKETWVQAAQLAKTPSSNVSGR